MKKILLVVFIVALLSLASTLSMKNENLKHFISETNPKFSFDYPIFEEWKDDASKDKVRYLPGKKMSMVFETPPAIYFKFLDTFFDWDETKTLTNRNGLKYLELGSTPQRLGHITIFKIEQTFLEINTPKGAIYENFSGEQIWKTVIESLKSDN